MKLIFYSRRNDNGYGDSAMIDNSIIPGTRVLVFDPTLFIDDVKTPLSFTMRSATVICRYGLKDIFGTYPDLVDVLFDHKKQISKAHFTSFVSVIKDT